MMIWLMQTRPDIGRKMRNLASSINSCVAAHDEFVKWCRAVNKLTAEVRFCQFRIVSKSVLRWQPKSNAEYLNSVHLFVFSDASFASVRNEGSVESYEAPPFFGGTRMPKGGSILIIRNERPAGRPTGSHGWFTRNAI